MTKTVTYCDACGKEGEMWMHTQMGPMTTGANYEFCSKECLKRFFYFTDERGQIIPEPISGAAA